MTSAARTDVGTIEDLHSSATRATGLDDFGDTEYLEPLGILLDSYRSEAGLTEIGSKMFRFFLKGALVARLLSEASWKANPGYADVEVTRPIFVTGLPRTGTTALHRLLAADPAHQGVEMWLAEFPQPRPPRDTWSDNPVYQQIQAGFEQHHVENPEFMGLHYMDAGEVEECWQLLRQSVMSISYESLAHIPTYSRWLAQQDWTPAYLRHRKNLQLIGLNDPGKRWVLKNPSHLFALDALMAAYPDALVIQTHRPPSTLIASMCSLAEHATPGWSTTFTGEQVGQDQLELWSRGLREFSTARKRYDPAQFLDIDFTDLRNDPMGTVERVYAALDTPMSEDARAAVTALDEESRSGARKPQHRYQLADYGLDEATVEAAFAV
ncbi:MULTISPECIES: sulfotransferase [unclassified Gordonia (in: high G+C Gram-positive bacteria)]|uniref:sulfotransferase family protein n=1 Tax=Gordonia TaxID=2053 RepID=UPI00071D8995|nr:MULTISPECIES: sulfotransferase [unclassified Gordonia (in: high G+C Gram-positive bacteria)]MCZ4533911.1 sulfotransferase [Gordonia terrae]KSU58753.1 sulfotransferase [Gordonia sp. SGD-V-85]MBR7192272.1 sulfotransferase [Gordonia sp. SCSIO 19800]OCH83016.1 sulfotransferase [Gordonia sp. UCD-TK1]SCC12953.1 Sulfotransferase family protein [Gordonia sp. v-85]